MLKGVAHINLNSGHENSGKNVYRKFLKGANIKHEDIHDSINISQGYKILRDYNINLKKFRKNELGILEVKFTFDQIEFSTSLNIDSFTNFLKLNYDLIYIQEKPDFIVSVFTNSYFPEQLNNYLKINNIIYLMERIKSLGISSEINISNTYALSNLLDGIYRGTLEEFKHINSVLVSVVKNIFNLGIKFLPETTLENELLLIEKISPIDGHC